MSDPVTVRPPCPVMLARAGGPRVPTGDYLYEPKWDGFRALIFSLPDAPVVQSRSCEDISYAFPEIVEAARSLPVGTVLDGELAVLHEGRIDFTVLSSRLRPRSEADGHIVELSRRHPGVFIAFDLVALPGVDLREHTAAQRRDRLAALHLPECFHLTPCTSDHATARHWAEVVAGAGLDGVIAKPADSTYQPGVRALTKVKPEHTADVVVAGWRPYKNPGPDGQAVVGSLLLGVYDDAGRLHHVGSASSFTVAKRAEFAALLAADATDGPHPWRDPEPGVRVPDAPNRWRRSATKDLHLLEPERVAEVRFDSMIDGRFRHVAKFLRWRPDRRADSCRFDQFPVVDPLDVSDVLSW